jgi:hypothetical protein
MTDTNDSEVSARGFFTPRAYDRLKFVALILLPALASLWFGVGGLWQFPHTTEVVGTITLIDTFLGVVLQLSSNAYYKTGANFDGELKMVTKEDGDEKLVFDVQTDPETVMKKMGKHTFEFRVNRNGTQ